MSTPPLDSDAIRIFNLVLGTGSLGRAAAGLGFSLARASRLLAKLEDHFGEPLFTRSWQGMVPTARALLIAPTMRRLGEAFGELESAEVFSPKSLERTFAIAAPDNGLLCVLPPVLREVSRAAPGVGFSLQPVGEDLLKKLREGDVDLALHPRKDLPPGFHSLELFELDRVCLVRRGHPLVGRLRREGRLREEDLEPYERIAVGQRSSGGRGKTTDVFHFAERQKTRVLVHSFLAAPFYLAGTDLTLFLPEPTGRLFARLLGLEVIVFHDERLKLKVGIVWHDRLDQDPACQWLRSMIAAHSGPRGDDGAVGLPAGPRRRPE